MRAHTQSRLSVEQTSMVVVSVCVCVGSVYTVTVNRLCSWESLSSFSFTRFLWFLTYLSFSKCLSILASTLSFHREREREETEVGHLFRLFQFHCGSLMLSFPFPYLCSILWNVAQPLSLSLFFSLPPPVSGFVPNTWTSGAEVASMNSN